MTNSGTRFISKYVCRYFPSTNLNHFISQNNKKIQKEIIERKP